jgi:hypothetical protein
MALVGNLALGFVIWGDLPTASTIVEATIVTLSWLYLLSHEAFQRGPPPAAPAKTRPAV